MISEKSFKTLKEELTNSSVVLTKGDGGYQFSFNNYDDLISYKHKLNHLHLEFVDELHTNLNVFSNRNQALAYLDKQLEIFTLLKKQIKNGLNDIPYHINTTVTSGQNPSIQCVGNEFIGAEYLVGFLKHQQKVIKESIRIIKTLIRKKNNLQDEEANQIDWRDLIKDLYPYLSKIKDQLEQIALPSEKVEYLKNTKRNIGKELKTKGIDIHNSLFSFIIDIYIGCCKEMLLRENHSMNNNGTPQLKIYWNASKTDFLELLFALTKIGIFTDEEGIPIPRNQLMEYFVIIFNLDEMKDFESRITKLIDRKDPASFLRRLLEVIELSAKM
ncbi:RteC domain-containing protein [Marinifilum flexuosum]|uniref:RteC domain-containing protein n=1 Tax=Marinifilum flexuosum TaxID=1117708 RepID=UPI0024944057|nr:RteC domain-containing protein [Marinifilum flexuosum]